MYIYVYCDILLTREIRITTPTTPLTHNPNTPYIGMFNHKDTLGAPAWQIQLTGQKTWHICPPDMDRCMYTAGDVDAFNPDYKRFPLFLEVCWGHIGVYIGVCRCV